MWVHSLGGGGALAAVQLLLLASSGTHGGDTRTAVSPVMGEGGAKWNHAELDCTGGGGLVTILRATYGVPCAPGCASCGAVPLGNLDTSAQMECNGKQKCVVSSCPCPPRASTCPAGSQCIAEWVDPAISCMKGLTVTYRCGDSPWGVSFIVAMLLLAVGYVGGGIGIGVKTSGGKSELAAHPHYRQWQELRGMVNDGLQLVKGGRPQAPSGYEHAAKGGAPKESTVRTAEASRKQGSRDGKRGDGEKRKSASPKKSRSSSKSKHGSGGASGEAGQALAPAAPAVASAPEPRVWQPTRSVLQTGARETGVKVSDHQPGQGLVGLR